MADNLFTTYKQLDRYNTLANLAKSKQQILPTHSEEVPQIVWEDQEPVVVETNENKPLTWWSNIQAVDATPTVPSTVQEIKFNMNTPQTKLPEQQLPITEKPQLLPVGSDFAKKAAQIASTATTFDSDSRGKNTPLGKGEYKGLCTSGPKTYYNKAGLKIESGDFWDTGSPKTAKNTKLTKKGFKEVWTGSADDAKSGKFKDVLQPGDIILNYGTKRSGQNSAHAAIWDGNRWVSDTDQGTTAFVYPKGRLGDRSAVLLRHFG